MNKLLIVLMAICLVSVHGFVKRDAPATGASTGFEDLQKQFTDLANSVNEKIKENFNPEKLKEDVTKALDDMKKQLENFKLPENKS